MITRPTITVVIPAYNLAGIVGNALRSVLEQTDRPDEVVVVDDGSTDATELEVQRVVERASADVVRVIRQTHQGPGASRNAGIAAAHGDWVAFLDGDDTWSPEKLQHVRAAIMQHPDADMIAHDDYEVGLDGRSIHRPLHHKFDDRLPLLPQLYRGNFLATSCVTVRKQLLRQAGGFDVSLGSAQDFDLWLRLARSARLVFIPKALQQYVHRRGSISSNVRLRHRCVIQIAYRHAPFLTASVGRRRAFLLRLRLIGVTHYAAILHLWRGDVVPADVLRVCLRAPIELTRALLRPLRMDSDEAVTDIRVEGLTRSDIAHDH
jgi:glycosyltransferase involved in cell wall biosynthesis